LKLKRYFLKNDFKFLGVDYPIEIEKEENVKKIWGFPYVPLTDPVPLGLISGFSVGAMINYYKKRPSFSSKLIEIRTSTVNSKILKHKFLKGIHLHLISTVVIGASLKFAYDYLEKRTVERELVIWDYVKRHPKDFPEVFNREILILFNEFFCFLNT